MSAVYVAAVAVVSATALRAAAMAFLGWLLPGRPPRAYAMPPGSRQRLTRDDLTLAS